MIEKVADVQHEIWSHWMKYLFEVSTYNKDGSVTIPADKVDRWKRQMNTSFDELDKEEQKSDLEQAQKVIAVLKKVQE